MRGWLLNTLDQQVRNPFRIRCNPSSVLYPWIRLPNGARHATLVHNSEKERATHGHGGKNSYR